MDPRDALLHGADEIEVEAPRQIGMDPALHADLRRASLPRLFGFVRDLGQRERVRLRVHLALRERAEPASHVADVREVDVPVDDVGHLGTDGLGAELVGDPAQRVERRSLGAEQGEGLRHR